MVCSQANCVVGECCRAAPTLDDDACLGDGVEDLAIEQGVRTRSGRLIDKGFLYKLLNNRLYIGAAVHKGTSYPAEHQPIICRTL